MQDKLRALGKVSIAEFFWIGAASCMVSLVTTVAVGVVYLLWWWFGGESARSVVAPPTNLLERLLALFGVSVVFLWIRDRTPSLKKLVSNKTQIGQVIGCFAIFSLSPSWFILPLIFLIFASFSFLDALEQAAMKRFQVNLAEVAKERISEYSPLCTGTLQAYLKDLARIVEQEGPPKGSYQDQCESLVGVVLRVARHAREQCANSVRLLRRELDEQRSSHDWSDVLQEAQDRLCDMKL